MNRNYQLSDRLEKSSVMLKNDEFWNDFQNEVKELFRLLPGMMLHSYGNV
jgi:hypothetical protein